MLNHDSALRQRRARGALRFPLPAAMVVGSTAGGQRGSTGRGPWVPPGSLLSRPIFTGPSPCPLRLPRAGPDPGWSRCWSLPWRPWRQPCWSGPKSSNGWPCCVPTPRRSPLESRRRWSVRSFTTPRRRWCWAPWCAKVAVGSPTSRVSPRSCCPSIPVSPICTCPPAASSVTSTRSLATKRCSVSICSPIPTALRPQWRPGTAAGCPSVAPTRCCRAGSASPRANRFSYPRPMGRASGALRPWSCGCRRCWSGSACSAWPSGAWAGG